MSQVRQHKISKFLQCFVCVQIVMCSCPVEYSNVSDIKVKWYSNSTINNEIVISQPPCTINNHLVTRLCSNGSWYPSKQPPCDKISNSTCPLSYQTFDDFCVKVTNATTYNTDNVWFPVQRKTKFGYFEWVEIGEKYGTTFLGNFSYPDYYAGDCMIFYVKTKTLKIENCTQTHKNVNYFQQRSSLYDCPEGCVAVNTKNRCFCKLPNCTKYARIRSVNDKIILEKLTGDDVCQIGGKPPHFLKNLNPYFGKNSWSYDDIKTNCSLCEIKAHDTETTKLSLSFEESSRELFLLVYSPNGLKKVDGYLVYCFTNAHKINLKERIKSKMVYENSDLVVFKVELKNYMGEYWCESFSSTLNIIKSNTVVAFKKKKGNEFSLRIKVRHICKLYSCNFQNIFIKLTQSLKENFDAEARVMEVFDFDSYNDVVDILLHLSTGKNHNVLEDYIWIDRKLKQFKLYQVIDFRSSEFCLPDASSTLHFPLTKINSASVPEEFCSEKDGTPVVRRCEGSFLYGAEWGNISGTCDPKVQISDVTVKIKDVAKARKNIEDIWDFVKASDLDVLDIYYLNSILNQNNQSWFVADLVEKLIETNLRVLKKGQDLLNLTDYILENVDNVLANCPQEITIRQKNFDILVTNPLQSNISGLLLYEKEVVYIKRGDSFEHFPADFLVGIEVPEAFFQQLNATNISLIFIVFYNDNLFVDSAYRAENFVVSVSIPGYGSYLQEPVSVMFRNQRNDSKCGFWDNGKAFNRKKGQWSFMGSNSLPMENFQYCSFSHLTHFALLLMSDGIYEEDDFTDVDLQNEDILQILTIIGFSFSIFGIVGIFLTAFLFTTWREKIGTKILLNQSLAILLEMVGIYLSEIKLMRESEQVCKIIGMVLHYVVLSKFSWMLIYAVLQYYRFVKVIGAIPKNLILKSVIIGWGVPLLWVFLVGISTNQSYVSTSYELCYPRGFLLYLTVIIPVCLIVLANIIIFCLVMYHVTYTNKVNSSDNKRLLKLRLYLALLLFSALGIPWVFGIIAELTPYSQLKIILFYIFCTTATMQGFVLFLFYVVLNTETRQLWLRLAK